MESKNVQNNRVHKENLIVEFKNNFYDLTKFILKHPGGVNTLINKNERNIEKIFYETEHSKAAENLLSEYKITKEEIKDENLENLVDWNAAMIPQISKLKNNYYEWVNLPVDRPLRLFQNNFVESITKTPWYLPLAVWLPFITFCVINQINFLQGATNKTFIVISQLFYGIVIWTVLEYLLHRFLFHIDVQKYPKLNTLHFVIHGLHHKCPFDPFRLVFPPIPAAVLATILYQPFVLLYNLNLIAYPRLLLAGALMGYLCYDMIHFYLHHGSPTNKYLYNLKRYHHNHHFINHDKGYGISSTLWDHVFNTRITLKKLKVQLKWRL